MAWEERLEPGGRETGGGDQGMMFGFACDDAGDANAVALAHKLARRLAQVSTTGRSVPAARWQDAGDD